MELVEAVEASEFVFELIALLLEVSVSVKVCVTQPDEVALLEQVIKVLSLELVTEVVTGTELGCGTALLVALVASEAVVVVTTVISDEDIALSMSASKSIIRLPTSTSGQLSLSFSNSKSSLFFVDFFLIF